mmetsp:Transcript_57705/g.171683  ORF Transcript_57705/g.171683 Transcript_57705/m.171683 type:complete len:240 (+) Transcript_57705:441-1160(+)
MVPTRPPPSAFGSRSTVWPCGSQLAAYSWTPAKSCFQRRRHAASTRTEREALRAEKTSSARRTCSSMPCSSHSAWQPQFWQNSWTTGRLGPSHVWSQSCSTEQLYTPCARLGGSSASGSHGPLASSLERGTHRALEARRCARAAPSKEGRSRHRRSSFTPVAACSLACWASSSWASAPLCSRRESRSSAEQLEARDEWKASRRRARTWLPSLAASLYESEKRFSESTVPLRGGAMQPST